VRTRQRHIFVLAIVLTVPSFAAGAEVTGQATQVDSGEQKPAGPRLRFRKGPVCMCSGGLSEKDIRNAEKARRAKKTKNQKEDSL